MKTKLPTVQDVQEFLHIEWIKKYNGVYTARQYFKCVFFPNTPLGIFRYQIESGFENSQSNWDYKIISCTTRMKTYPNESYYEIKFTLSEAK